MTSLSCPLWILVWPFQCRIGFVFFQLQQNEWFYNTPLKGFTKLCVQVLKLLHSFGIHDRLCQICQWHCWLSLLWLIRYWWQGLSGYQSSILSHRFCLFDCWEYRFWYSWRHWLTKLQFVSSKQCGSFATNLIFFHKLALLAQWLHLSTCFQSWTSLVVCN